MVWEKGGRGAEVEDVMITEAEAAVMSLEDEKVVSQGA
jgi:hypothetical protein